MEHTPEQNTIPIANDSFFKKHFCTVTPLSKYLALFVFIMLPIIGFNLGFNYGSNYQPLPQQNKFTEDKSEIAIPNYAAEEVTPEEIIQLVATEVQMTPEIIIQKLYGEYKSFLSPQQSGNFAWPVASKDNEEALIVEGLELNIQESWIQEIDQGVQIAFMLDEQLVAFLKQSGLNKKIFYLKNNPTLEDKSIIGFETNDSNVVCTRVIMDSSQLFLGYKIACGYLPQ